MLEATRGALKLGVPPVRGSRSQRRRRRCRRPALLPCTSLAWRPLMRTLYGSSVSKPSTMSATVPRASGTSRRWMIAPRLSTCTSTPPLFFSTKASIPVPSGRIDSSSVNKAQVAHRTPAIPACREFQPPGAPRCLDRVGCMCGEMPQYPDQGARGPDEDWSATLAPAACLASCRSGMLLGCCTQR